MNRCAGVSVGHAVGNSCRKERNSGLFCLLISLNALYTGWISILHWVSTNPETPVGFALSGMAPVQEPAISPLLS